MIKNIDQVLEYAPGMFSEGGDKGLETSEVRCAPSGLEIGSHLLLGFEASDVSFGLFVGDQYPGLLADFIQIEPELMHLHGPF